VLSLAHWLGAAEVTLGGPEELAFGVLSSFVLAGAVCRAVGAVVGVAAGCALGGVCW
jgi:hypothetical protein